MSKLPIVQEVYCDESGFTGNDLLNEQQPVFVYSGVAITDQEAIEYLNWLKIYFNLKSNEIKGQNLLNKRASRRNLKVVKEVVREMSSRTYIAVSKKEFHFASKFINFFIRPLLMEKENLFESIGFFQFLINFLYQMFQFHPTSGNKVKEEMENYMRGERINNLSFLFTNQPMNEQKDIVLELFRRICFRHKAQIDENLISKTQEYGNWLLDISNAGLYAVMNNFSKQYEKVEIYYDESKPLTFFQNNLLQELIKEKPYEMEINGEKRIFDLSSIVKIEQVKSQEKAGIQLADIMACATQKTFLLHKKDSYYSELATIIANCSEGLTLQPNDESFNIQQNLNARLSCLLFVELANRSHQNSTLLFQLEEFIQDKKRKIDDGVMLSPKELIKIVHQITSKAPL